MTGNLMAVVRSAVARLHQQERAELHRAFNVAVWLAAGLMMLVLCGILQALPQAGARLERQMFEAMDQENGVLCEKLGIPAGTHRHVVCKMDLLDLRRRHEKRWLEANPSPL